MWRLVALILSIFVVEPAWAQSTLQPPSAQSAQQQGAQDERGTEKSPVVVKVIPTEKSKDELAREDAKDQQKLAVDERVAALTGDLAKYTKLLFWATGALAVFTLGLVIFGFRQANDAKESIAATRTAAQAAQATVELAQREFISTHRPRLIVRNVHAKMLGADQPIAIRFTIINKGQTDALRTEWRVGVIILDAGRNIYGMEGIDAPRQTLGAPLASGMDYISDFESRKPLDQTDLDSVDLGEKHLWFCGVIAYFDGANNVRRTGFVRRYDGGTKRFRLTNNPDDEYED